MLLLLILLRDTDNLYHVIPANGTSSICQLYLVFVLAFILGMESAVFFVFYQMFMNLQDYVCDI